MRNSRHVDVQTRSLRSDDLRTYLREQTQECDEQIAELRERIQMRKQLSATAPLPTSHRLEASSTKSESSKSASRSLRFETRHSDIGDVGSDDSSRRRIRSHTSRPDHSRELPSSQQHSSAPRGILKASTAPSSPERPRSTTSKQRHQRGILKKPHEPRSEQHSQPQHENPEAWFQRVMRAKQLSPLDLCDLFSFGDARKHATVPLSHVCEVLFDLDPEVRASGYDPVTPEMEEFLYQFSFEGPSDGARGDRTGASEIVVNVKDALRSLNIWQSGVTSPVKTQSTDAKPSATPCLTESASPAKTAVLEAKNKKLHEVISSLQDANLRLSRQLDRPPTTAVGSPHGAVSKAPSQSSHSRTVASSFATSSSSLASSWLAHSDASSSSKPTLHTTSGTVNCHEDALVKIAHRLQYSGVKQLEELLVKSETLQSSRSRTHDNSSASCSSTSTSTSTGFVSLKQLRWLLSEHFGLDVRETQLTESCLGMNFNARAQLDHREFTHTLLDILLYAPPQASAAKTQLLFASIRQYMASGFDARDDAMNYKTLTALCAKYDLERDECISVAELMRVLSTDLVKRHALHVAFPLTQQDALRIVQPFVIERSGDTGTRAGGAGTGDAGATAKRAFLRYPAFLAAVFALPGKDSDSDNENHGTVPFVKQALDSRFWVQLRKALCSGNRALEPSIHAQLCKIFRKIDPKRHYVVAQRTFARIFDQHLSAEQLRAVCAALAMPQNASSHSSSSRHNGQGREQHIIASELDPSDALRHRPREQGHHAAAPLRFDVFMKLVFGAPALQDTAFSHKRIIAKLQEHEAAIRTRVVALLKAHGGGYETSPRTLHDLVNGDDASEAKTKKESSGAVLTPCELLYAFASLDDAHEGHVTLQTLWTFLKTECWRTRDATSGTARPNSRCRSSANGPEGPRALVKTRGALAQCLNAYNLERALERYKREHHGSISQDQLLKEIYRMLHALGQDDDADALDPARLQQLLASIAAEVHSADADLATSRRLHLPIPIDAFFGALVDWDALARALQLPHHLVDVKRALEVFDWSRDGTIAVADWPKAWRMVSARSKAMAEWEVRALQRRFPAVAGPSPSRSGAPASVSSKSKRSRSRSDDHDSDMTSDAAINYAQLLVHLMDRQHEHAQHRMKTLVIGHFRALGSLSHRQVDQLYRRIDVADKGHINLSDLQQYVATHVIGKTATSTDGDDESDDRALVQNVNVMSSVLQSLASSSKRSGDSETTRVTTVSRSHFQAFMERLTTPPCAGDDSSRGHSRSSSSERGEHGRLQLDSFDVEDSGGADSPSPTHRAPRPQVLTSLRALELVILDICSAVARAPDGGILPTKAFRYLSTGVTRDDDEEANVSGSPRLHSSTQSASRASSRSPVRQHTARHRVTSRSRSPVPSLTVRSQHREVESMRLDPLTPTALQHVLLDCHNLDASHMLVTQFFEHIGARSKRLLELVVFAKWVAPLSVAMTTTVRAAVKQMVMRGKGGGGCVDLDRFFTQLQRKLLDAPSFDAARPYDDDSDATTVRYAPLPLLQTALQQLGVRLSRVDMETLLRHVGMEEETGAIDVALFLQRIAAISEASTS